MQVPFLNLKMQLPDIRKEIESKFSTIIDNTSFVCGSNVSEFEKKYSELHQVKYTVGLSSGTDGNHLSMLVCGIGNGDEVIVPVNTFIATAEGISHAGGRPVFIDVDAEASSIDVSKIEDAITPQTRAINPVHLFGQPVNMEPILEIAKRHNIFVIEDAAQAHCAEYKGKRIGGIGDIASWSFYPGKNLGAWGEAGCVTTNNEEFYINARKLRDHGSDRKYYHEKIGHNYRMSEFQAAVLIVKMKFIEQWTEIRRANAEKYNEQLKDIEQIVTPVESPNGRHVYHLYVIKTKKRNKLQSYLNERGIGTGIHYPFPLHLTKAYSCLGYTAGDFPVAEKLSTEILSLPMYPELTESQIGYVCETILSFFRK
jgi:dTDP-4-amino-4,6-dideoxygalactose transaminase